MEKRSYPQCSIGGRPCTIPDCGPPWCLPDGSYTNSRGEADEYRRADTEQRRKMFSDIVGQWTNKDLVTELPWVSWWKLWRRCGERYPAKFTDQDYYGRCELDKKHVGIMQHALERGMDTPRWW